MLGEWVLIDGERVYLEDTTSNNKAKNNDQNDDKRPENLSQNPQHPPISKTTSTSENDTSKYQSQDWIMNFAPGVDYFQPQQLIEAFRTTRDDDSLSRYILLEAILWPCIWGSNVLRPRTRAQIQSGHFWISLPNFKIEQNLNNFNNNNNNTKNCSARNNLSKFGNNNNYDNLSWSDDLDATSDVWELDPDMLRVDSYRLRTLVDYLRSKKETLLEDRTRVSELDGLALKERTFSIQKKLDFLLIWLSIIEFYHYNGNIIHNNNNNNDNKKGNVKPIMVTYQVDFHGQSSVSVKALGHFFLHLFSQRKKFLSLIKSQEYQKYIGSMGTSQRPTDIEYFVSVNYFNGNDGNNSKNNNNNNDNNLFTTKMIVPTIFIEGLPNSPNNNHNNNNNNNSFHGKNNRNSHKDEHHDNAHNHLMMGISNIFPNTPLGSHCVFITGRGVHSNNLQSVLYKEVGSILKTRKCKATVDEYRAKYNILIQEP
jgi:hypothetical protein